MKIIKKLLFLAFYCLITQVFFQFKADNRQILIEQKKCINCKNMQNSNLDNQKLEGAKVIRSDLSGSSMKYIIFNKALLQDLNLSGSNMDHAQLKNTNLMGSNLTKSIVTNADLTNSKLSEATVLNTDFSNSIFDNTDLTNLNKNIKLSVICGAASNQANSVIFKNTKISNSNFQNSILSGSNFEQATIENNTKFTKTKLNCSSFKDASIKNTDFSGSDLSFAYLAGDKFHLSNSKFDNANLFGAKIDFSKIDISNSFSGTIFSTKKRKANLQGTTFIKMLNLSNAIFEGANLAKSFFNQVNLNGTNLQNTDMTEVTMCNVDLAQTKLNGTKLVNAILINMPFKDQNDIKKTLSNVQDARGTKIFIKGNTKKSYYLCTNTNCSEIQEVTVNQKDYDNWVQVCN